MISARRTVRRKTNKNTVKIGITRPILVNVTIRRTLGAEINASCGQLRKSYMDMQKTQ